MIDLFKSGEMGENIISFDLFNCFWVTRRKKEEEENFFLVYTMQRDPHWVYKTAFAFWTHNYKVFVFIIKSF